MFMTGLSTLEKKLYQLLIIHLSNMPGLSSKVIQSPLSFFGVDSLTMTTIIISIEKEFCLQFHDDELSASNFKSIQSIASLLCKKLE